MQRRVLLIEMLWTVDEVMAKGLDCNPSLQKSLQFCE